MRDMSEGRARPVQRTRSVVGDVAPRLAFRQPETTLTHGSKGLPTCGISVAERHELRARRKRTPRAIVFTAWPVGLVASVVGLLECQFRGSLADSVANSRFQYHNQSLHLASGSCSGWPISRCSSVRSYGGSHHQSSKRPLWPDLRNPTVTPQLVANPLR